MPGILVFLPSYLRGRAFGESNKLMFRALYNYLPRPTCGNEIKMLLKAILCGRVWNGVLLGKAKKEDVPCRFCGKSLFGECTFLPSSMLGNCLSSPGSQHVASMSALACVVAWS